MATTWPTIRDNYITKIKAITPTYLTGYKFDRCPTRKRLRDWAPLVGSAALRKFEFFREGEAREAQLAEPAALERNEMVTLTVAYPVEVALYGAAELDELERVMWFDAYQIRDVVWSVGNYVTGQHVGWVEVGEADRADSVVWYQPITVLCIYSEAMTLNG